MPVVIHASAALGHTLRTGEDVPNDKSDTERDCEPRLIS